MGHAPILMYHAVDTQTDPMLVQVSPSRLREQLQLLRRLGLRGVSVRELLEAPRKRGLVGLTFDDGYADFATAAVPILEDFGWTATVFMVAGRLGGANDWDPPPRRPLMTAEQLRSVAGAGHEVGSHGMNHIALPESSIETLREELAGSRAALEEILGSPVTGFCYPYGTVDRPTAEAVSQEYEYGCAIAATIADRWTLPRFHVGERDGTLRMLAKLALRPARERRQSRSSRIVST